MKTTDPTKQEQARLDIENAEDDLVQKTEVAITLMKTVLENVRSVRVHFFSTSIKLFPQPEPIKNLNELIKAQVSAPLSTAFRLLMSVSWSTLPLPPRHFRPHRATLRT